MHKLIWACIGVIGMLVCVNAQATSYTIDFQNDKHLKESLLWVTTTCDRDGKDIPITLLPREGTQRVTLPVNWDRLKKVCPNITSYKMWVKVYFFEGELKNSTWESWGWINNGDDTDYILSFPANFSIIPTQKPEQAAE